METGTIELISLAYDGVLVPARWEAFLARLADQLGGASLGMSLRHPCDGDPGWVVFHDTDPSFARAYAEHFFSVDPFRVRSDALVPGACELMAGGTIEAAAIERSEFYADWMRPQGLAPAPSIGVTLDRDPRGEPIGIGVFRPRGARAYGDAELRLLSALVPHLQRATRTARRLASSAAHVAASDDALELLPAAALLMDADGNVVRANLKAARLAEHGDPFTAGARLALQPDVVLELRRARLQLRTGRRDARRASARDAVVVRRGESRPPLRLHVLPCSSPEIAGIDGPSGWFLVLIDDPEDVPQPSPEAIAATLGLTSAEGRLCALLVAGRRLDQAATELGIAHETARTHLKSAFRKTGARSQTDLVRLVLQRPLLARGDL